MKSTLWLFALLDVLSIVLISPQIFDLIKSSAWLHADGITIAKVILFILLYISLIFSAILQFKLRKSGLIIYYIQFVPRIITWVYSIGFLTLIGEYITDSQLAFEWLFRIVVMFEFLRIYLSVRIHRKYAL